MIKNSVVDISRIIEHPDNYNKHPEAQIKSLRESVRTFGQVRSVVLQAPHDANGAYLCVAGNGVTEAMRREGFTEVKADIVPSDWPPHRVRAYLIADNEQAKGSDPDLEQLAVLARDIQAIEPDLLMSMATDANDMLGGSEPEMQDAGRKLIDMFLVPPFSVLDARQGYWQDRKRDWNDVLDGGLGRKGNLLNMNPSIQPEGLSSTSIFDPVLCEVVYKWFTPKGAAILDPFSGGSTRGIVAEILGRNYTGIDLSAAQVDENIKQSATVNVSPNWIVGNSLKSIPDNAFDFVFSCPPYYDLERYSDDVWDLSNYPSYSEFLEDYRSIIEQCAARLKDNRFACFVVGEIRDKTGVYRNFVGDTITAFITAGCRLYNDAILVTALGNLQMRAGNMLKSGRKLGKTHQNVLVFIKGDWKLAADYCGEIQIQPELIT